jgi:CheY-like chemotaxis protein
MVQRYVSSEFSFLTNLGIQLPELAIITDVAKAHRKVKLQDQRDIVKRLGALMRLIDELDTGPSRAPIPSFLQRYGEMDDISLFHWYKHIITEPWTVDNNLQYQNINGRKEICFSPVVHPHTARSIPYWLTQVMRPIRKALDDEQCQKIISESYGVKVTVRKETELSSKLHLGTEWALIEDKVLGAGRHTILVVDDEIKRIDDLFLPLMEKYYVHCVPRVKSALEQLEAKPVDLLVVDMQMPADGLWTAIETKDFRFTGMKIAEHVRDKYPGTKIVGLTGIKYALPDAAADLFDSILRKPIDPLDLLDEVGSLLH